MKVQAAVLRGAEAPYQIEDIELAEPGAGEILVRVAGTGLCHTDMIPRAMAEMRPLVPGHEGAGVVEMVGPGVESIKLGDHVCLSYDSCGACRACSLGQPSYCAEFVARNLSGRTVAGEGYAKDTDGTPIGARWFGQSSLASHVIATERNAVVVDRSLPLDKLGPLGCGVQTGAGSVMVALDAQPGSSLVIFGSGAVGLSGILGAVVAGVSTIIAVDLHAHRLDLAKEFGATHTINGDAQDVVEEVREITGGAGADYSLETTGVPGVMRNAVLAVRLGGSAALVGAQQGDLPVDGVMLPGRTLVGVLEGSVVPQQFIPRMIELWRDGRFPFDRMITTFKLSEVNEAERASLSGAVIKPVLIP